MVSSHFLGNIVFFVCVCVCVFNPSKQRMFLGKLKCDYQEIAISELVEIQSSELVENQGQSRGFSGQALWNQCFQICKKKNAV